MATHKEEFKKAFNDPGVQIVGGKSDFINQFNSPNSNIGPDVEPFMSGGRLITIPKGQNFRLDRYSRASIPVIKTPKIGEMPSGKLMYPKKRSPRDDYKRLLASK